MTNPFKEEGLEGVLDMALISIIIAGITTPLAIWKLVDITIWIYGKIAN